MSDRANVKAVLEAAKVEIEKAVGRVDKADASQLAELKGAARLAAAFVDFNTGCGKGALSSHELAAKLHG